jgi:hypothetical protein
MDPMQESDEIDLLKLADQIWQFVFKNKWLFIVAIALGGLGGYASFRLSPKVYKSEMMVHSDIITPVIGKTLIDEINSLIGRKDWVKLSGILNISPEQTSGIVFVNIKNPIERAEPSFILETKRKLLSIELKSTEPALFPAYQRSIVSYLETNEYSKSRGQLKKNLYGGIYSKIEDEITNLEKVRKEASEEKSSSEKNRTILELTKINSEVVELTRLKFCYKDSLDQVNKISEINGFSIIVAPRPYKLIVFGMAIGLMVSLLIIWIKSRSV